MKLLLFLHKIRIALYGWDIFISHKKDESAKYARKLKDILEVKGYKCFLDEKNMSIGERLETEINNGLNLSQSLVLIGTDNALESKFVKYEVDKFKRDILPINVNNTLNKSELSKLQRNEKIWIDESVENINSSTPSKEVLESIELYFNKRKVKSQRIYAQLGFVSILMIAGLLASVFYLSNEKTKLENERIQKENKNIEIEREFARREAKLKGDSLEIQAKLTLVETSRANQEDSLKKAEKIALIGDDILKINPLKALLYSNFSNRYAKTTSSEIVAKKALSELPENAQIKIHETGFNKKDVKVFHDIKPLKKLEAKNNFVISLNHNGKLKIVSLANNKVIFESKEEVKDFIISKKSDKVFCLLKNGDIFPYKLISAVVTKWETLGHSFSGLETSHDNLFQIGWKANGEIFSLEQGKQILKPQNINAIACGIDDNVKSVWFLDQTGKLFKISLKDYQLTTHSSPELQALTERINHPLDMKSKYELMESLKLSPGVRARQSTKYIFELRGSIKNETYNFDIALHINEKLNKLIISASEEYISYLNIFNTTDMKEVSSSKGIFKYCYNPKEATIAMLDENAIQEYGLSFKKEPVKTIDNWYLDGYYQDLGEGREIKYSPNYQYIVSVNTPSMDNVAARASLVKLHYAEKFGDPRVGDEHQGRQIGQKYIKVLNTTFNEGASKLITYATDGLLRVYPILPEKYGSETRAADYFYGTLFLPAEYRKLIAEKSEKVFFNGIKAFNKLQSDKSKSELNSFANGKLKLIQDDSLEKDLDRRTGTITLQSREQVRYEIPPLDNSIAEINLIFNNLLQLKNQGKLEESLKGFENLYKNYTLKGLFLSNVLNQCGWIALQLKDYPKAINYFEKAVNANFPSGWAYVNWGESLKQLGKIKEGISKMYNGVQLAQKSKEKELPNILNEYAWFVVENPQSVSSNQLKKAKELSAISCLKQYQENYDYYNFLDTYAHFWALEKNFSKAIEIEKQALEKAPKNKKSDFQSQINNWTDKLKK